MGWHFISKDNLGMDICIAIGDTVALDGVFERGFALVTWVI